MPYFIFKNVNSKAYNIHINLMPPIQTVDESVEYVEVPGRGGYLTIPSRRRPTLEKEMEITIYPETHMREIKRWLRGDGRLILSNDPDVYYKARVQTIRDLWGFAREDGIPLMFICQPWAYLLSGDTPIIIDSKNTVLNNPEELAKPIFKIYGTGAVELIINNTIHKFNIDEHITVDSELKESYKDNSLVPFIGAFPELVPGINNITWDGNVSKIEVIPRWCR